MHDDFVMGARKKTSYLLCCFRHGSPATQRQPVDKSRPSALQPPQFRIRHPGELADDMDHPLVVVLDPQGNEAFFLERSDMGGNPPGMEAEEICEIGIGSKAPAFIVQGMDFDKEHFFHKRK